jgi:excisionase family DNA binding protein
MNTTDDHPARLTLFIPDVASLLGRTELATRRMIERGELPARRWGHRIVVLRDELEQHLHALLRRGEAK